MLDETTATSGFMALCVVALPGLSPDLNPDCGAIKWFSSEARPNGVSNFTQPAPPPEGSCSNREWNNVHTQSEYMNSI